MEEAIELKAAQAEADRINVRNTRTIEELAALVKKHQKIQSISCGNTLAEQVEYIIEEYQRSAENATTSATQFRDRISVDLRALNLIVSSCLNSETHKEKDAHLRILAKLLGSALEWLRNANFQSVWGTSFYFNRDPFQCDWPVREMKNRIYELEQENEKLKKVVPPTPPPSENP